MLRSFSLAILYLSCAFAIYLSSPSLEERVGSIDAQPPRQPTESRGEDISTASAAFQSALPLGSHPLSGGVILTPEEEIFDLRREMKDLRADYTMMRRDLDRIKAELKAMRGNSEILTEWQIGRGADAAISSESKEETAKQHNHER